MKTGPQIENKLENLKEALVKLKTNSVHRIVDPEAYQLNLNVLKGQINSLEWVLEIKFRRNEK